ncbi:MAG: YesL family protein [Oscillospiraceae bacterium]|nr:YesL family protein [Oscillospiraceae bacterium]
MALDLFKYGKAGKGVQKGGPKKKPFFLFWEIFGNKFWKFFQINLIFTLFCLPVVTFGPALAAMTQVMRKFVIGEPIFVFHEFKEAFKKNFKQSIGIGIFDILFVVVIVINISSYIKIIETGDTFSKVMFALCLAFSFIVYMMHFYIYPQIVALNLKMPLIIKNSFILMVVGIKRSFIGFFATAAIVALMALGDIYSLILLPLIPAAWMCFITTFCAYPVIQKHIVDPYYAARGEKNPEYARYETTDEALFEDKGGFEEPTDTSGSSKQVQHTRTDKVKVKGKVIR